MSAFIATLRESDASESIRLAFELLILPATRTSEVLRATWSEVDLDAKVWTIPGSRMKTGRDHRVPLSARAVEIFELAKASAKESAYVFPGRTSAKPLSNMVFLMAFGGWAVTTSLRTGFEALSGIGRRRRRTSRGPFARLR